MGVAIARIDQRLVHGIVVTQWASSVKAKRIMVVNDEVAKDEPRKATMRLSKPAGTGMSLINTETAITNFNAGKYVSHNVLLVVDNVETLLTLVKNGVEIPKVNIGIMLDKEGRTKYAKNFAASDKEMKQLEELSNMGIPVSYQFVPSNKEEQLSKFL
ncbi:PTS sugar transporter subunit IIB [Tetragenococcus koreensis]|uniref:PTS system mannose/fructose/N-acetylgalactosamine-transporter subunit IIB n=1 Tax=Tetragenococcus koreensis TaxID=290335 RepID=UPI000F50F0A5|nr:PTS sugar transporter subunit IIB [Tetragenococcus koreensis]AYW46533.1 PTS mannose/fructose/sorbose transporter subunit IIB [Tetragenococcus koreensis]MCF1585357.1 PTS sugar transporter subunit IIB [Tetragenococcus koreensis]MCF1619739.1 PTS sugar transporter subunit IIB [Tetragenococcus koreensis]MCF1629590.1 PTS sugar transporter subunit IIB [Tetragenococcus koreensis]MCF1657222.1 PTS sugar transporter subunit IIB [Tetragenococcus koreensis]